MLSQPVSEDFGGTLLSRSVLGLTIHPSVCSCMLAANHWSGCTLCRSARKCMKPTFDNLLTKPMITAFQNVHLALQLHGGIYVLKPCKEVRRTGAHQTKELVLPDAAQAAHKRKSPAQQLRFEQWLILERVGTDPQAIPASHPCATCTYMQVPKSL